jgi:hypothetical protein
MGLTIDEAIKHCEEVAEDLNEKACGLYESQDYEKSKECIWCAEEHRQLAEWLRELKAYRDFADWLAHAVLEEDWEESADFYAEVLCRKLTKLGKLKVVDNKYMEVNADECNL